ncbi:MAG: (2Fe-2S)-binding protein [Deltaproteobacteria bacterium]|nr:MAG: (2Fe-2S)-binding protein [Deltaproteobacteria bacterium]
MSMIPITLLVNGEPYNLMVPPNKTLLEVLRDDLELMGTREGCGVGACGACTVLIDDVPVRSCLTLAVDVQGLSITTIEGLAEGKELHPVQEAFVERQAIQCGFCSSGMILTAKAFLDKNKRPTKAAIKKAISGNICRCTGYTKIEDAIATAAKKRAKKSK